MHTCMTACLELQSFPGPEHLAHFHAGCALFERWLLSLLTAKVHAHLEALGEGHRHACIPTARSADIREQVGIPLCRGDRVVNNDDGALAEVRLDELERGERQGCPDFAGQPCSYLHLLARSKERALTVE